MECPACSRGLAPLELEALALDACDGGCGGIWFDGGELRKAGSRTGGPGALAAVRTDPAAARVDHDRRRECPRCAGMVMMRRLYSPASGVEIDECPACAGFWLDAGELAEISAELAQAAITRDEAVERVAAALPTELELERRRAWKDAEQARQLQSVLQLALGSLLRVFADLR